MPLIDLKTDLKSLKYGKDRPGGGNSGQPYMQTDINTIDRGFNRLRLTNFDDGLVRGGFVGATNASVVDTLRIGKFLTDLPKGPLFIAKQVGLQLSNPQLEYKKLRVDNPTSGGGLLRNVGNFILNTANKLVNAVGPTRIYNLGINTLAQVPVNAFGIHFNRHGLLPTQSEDTKYLNVAEYNNYGDGKNNRLVGYKSKFQLGDNKGNIVQNRSTINTINNILQAIGITTVNPIRLNPQQLTINDYISGPGSVYGIGNTLIRRYSFTEDGTKINFARNRNYVKQTLPGIKLYQTFDFDISNFTRSILSANSFNLKQEANVLSGSFQTYIASSSDKDSRDISQWNGALTASNDLGVSNQYFSGSEIELSKSDVATYSTIVQSDISLRVGANNNVLVTNDVTVQSTTPVKNASYKKYQEIVNSRKLRERTFTYNGNQVNAFGIYGNATDGVVGGFNTSNVLPDATSSPVYSNGSKVIRISKAWNEVTREIRIGAGLQDSINLTPMFTESKYYGNDSVNIDGKPHNIKDLIRFRIQAVDGDNPDSGVWMVFRALLTDLSDGSQANWSEVKYAGRGDKFFIYDGFTRKMNVSFKVAASSEEEMQFIYQKLNFLMSNTMPDYKNGYLMRGPLVRLSVGSWVDSQLGILGAVNFKIPQDSPWEISLEDNRLILPHIVEVSMDFTPIGSETRANNLIAEKSRTTSHIAQNNTGKDVNTLQYIK